MTTHRPEIDGLRAVAVVSVVFYHMGWTAFSGGFVGVDVFFVISGYLITTLILQEMQRGEFSLLHFYERRIRRIFPVLFVVLLASSIAGYYLMQPEQLRNFGKSLFAAVGFVANVFFWRQDGYFDFTSQYKPLLHLWSLSVEEQFYIFFPIFMFGLARLKFRYQVLIVAALLIASLCAAVIEIDRLPTRSFYSPHTRAWELLSGSCCAFWFLRFPARSSPMISCIGIALIFSSIFLFDHSTPFPSAWTLLPVGGTALTILFTHKTGVVFRVLNSRLLVGLGLISYSLYLWHVPLIVFARLRTAGELGQFQFMLIAILAVILSTLTWRFVEQPFRDGRYSANLSQQSIYTWLGSAVATVVLIASIIVLADGFPERTNRQGASYADLGFELRFRPNFGLNIICTADFALSSGCATTQSPEVLVWGDSFAMHVAQAVADALPQGVGVRQMTRSSCSPVFNLAPALGYAMAQECIRFNSQVDEWLRLKPGITTVVVSSPFSWLTDPKTTLINNSGAKISGGQDVALQSLREMIARLRSYGLRVIVISPTPRARFDVGHCLQNTLWATGRFEGCDFEVSKLSDATHRAHLLLKNLQSDVPIIWLDDILCDQHMCHAGFDGVALYRDSGHLSKEGAKWLGQNARFKSALNAAFKK
jgi:peptidoglycan/LPS O-acetylase OafA/YrhL